MGENRFSLPNINEIANFLNEYAPNVARNLASKGELYSDAVAIGVFGGDTSESIEKLKTGLSVRADVLAASLDALSVPTDKALKTIKRKLDNVRRARLASSAFAAITTSGVIGAIFIGTKSAVAVAIVALASNLVGLIADKWLLAGGENESGLQEVSSTLTRISSQSGLTKKLLLAIRATDFDPDEMANLLKEANGYFSVLTNALAKVPT